MILTNEIAKNYLVKYANKTTKLSKEVKNKRLFRSINGLYETNAIFQMRILSENNIKYLNNNKKNINDKHAM